MFLLLVMYNKYFIICFNSVNDAIERDRVSYMICVQNAYVCNRNFVRTVF